MYNKILWQRKRKENDYNRYNISSILWKYNDDDDDDKQINIQLTADDNMTIMNNVILQFLQMMIK